MLAKNVSLLIKVYREQIIDTDRESFSVFKASNVPGKYRFLHAYSILNLTEHYWNYQMKEGNMIDVPIVKFFTPIKTQNLEIAYPKL